MLARKALALVVVGLVAGCSGKAPGHTTTSSRQHDLIVENFTGEKVAVYVGENRQSLGDVEARDQTLGDELESLVEGGNDPKTYFWVVPGTWHVTLVGDSQVVDCGTITIVPGCDTYLSYQ